MESQQVRIPPSPMRISKFSEEVTAVTSEECERLESTVTKLSNCSTPVNTVHPYQSWDVSTLSLSTCLQKLCLYGAAILCLLTYVCTVNQNYQYIDFLESHSNGSSLIVQCQVVQRNSWYSDQMFDELGFGRLEDARRMLCHRGKLVRIKTNIRHDWHTYNGLDVVQTDVLKPAVMFFGAVDEEPYWQTKTWSHSTFITSVTPSI